MSKYSELYTRNFPLISKDLQNKLSCVRVAIAGCGSTGGAVVDAFLRLGINHFHLCDNGAYELNNLNRQMVFLEDIDQNKAIVQQKRILNVNSAAQVSVWKDGVTVENIQSFLDSVDFVFDAVDVTQKQGMEAKLLLHKEACKNKLPVGSALDLGYRQWLKGFNYHLGEPVLDGRLEKALMFEHPLKQLIEGFVSVEEIPYELLLEIERLIQNPEEGACQLGSACFLLSSMMGPYLIKYLEKNELPKLVAIDLMEFFESDSEKEQRRKRTQEAQVKISKLLREVN